MARSKETTPVADAVSEETGAGLLAGKKGLIVGVANDRSIAWGIARSAASAGATLAFTFQGEALERRVRPLAEQVRSPLVLPLDVTSDSEVDTAFDEIGRQLGTLDFVVHSVAYADRNDLAGRTVDTSRGGFLKAMEVSAYSLLTLARKAEPLMPNGGSIVTLSYYGAVRTVPNYNVMGIAKAALEAAVKYVALDLGEKGIRVNAISAGPIKTLAASGISGLRTMLSNAATRAPLKRNVDIDDVGAAGLYLLSSLSRGVTGEIHYVDAGFNITAM